MPNWVTSQKCITRVAACDCGKWRVFSFPFLLYSAVKTYARELLQKQCSWIHRSLVGKFQQVWHYCLTALDKGWFGIPGWPQILPCCYRLVSPCLELNKCKTYWGSSIVLGGSDFFVSALHPCFLMYRNNFREHHDNLFGASEVDLTDSVGLGLEKTESGVPPLNLVFTLPWICVSNCNSTKVWVDPEARLCAAVAEIWFRNWGCSVSCIVLTDPRVWPPPLSQWKSETQTCLLLSKINTAEPSYFRSYIWFKN